uniref:Parathyroid hormone n=1 Tax=Paramormyrops kingsleyae TaxID=1676925 RepID=A0A3B3QL93_9TELE
PRAGVGNLIQKGPLCASFRSNSLITRRSVSEVQLMHNLGEHRHLQERQDWIQTKLREIHTATLKGGDGWPELEELCSLLLSFVCPDAAYIDR